jgi:hypothetical protein
LSSVSSVAEICNLALDRIGWPRSIGRIYDGTIEARVAIRAYGQTRDDVLKTQDWDFAERLVALTPFTGTTPIGWQYAYLWPSDCLKVRLVSWADAPIPNFDPRPALFTDLNVAQPSSQRLIVANVSPANLTYTGQVTDMTTWDAAFTESLIEELARRFAEALNAPEQVVQGRAAMADQAAVELAGSQVSVPANIIRAPAREARQ